MANQLNTEDKIFIPQTKPFSCTKPFGYTNTSKIPLTLKNLNIHNNFKCIATNVSGINTGSQCINTKFDSFDYCFLHKCMVDSGKYFSLPNKRKSKYSSNSYTCSIESPLSSVSTYFDTDSTYNSNYSSISDESIVVYSDENETASTTSLSG